MSAGGLAVAAALGAAGGQLARVGARVVLRHEGGLVEQLASEMRRLGRDAAQLAGIVIGVLAGFWAAVVASLCGVALIIAGLICADTFEERPAQIGLVVAAIGAVVGFGSAMVLLERLLRRVRDVVQAEIDLGVPLVGPGRLWVVTTSVAAVGCYAALAGGTGGIA